MRQKDLDRDNIEAPGGFALLVGPDHVGLHLPVGDDGMGGWVVIPHEDFEYLARWYLARLERAALAAGATQEGADG